MKSMVIYKNDPVLGVLDSLMLAPILIIGYIAIFM